MEQRAWDTALGAAQLVDRISPDVTGVHVWVGAPGAEPYPLCESLLGVRRPFVLIARSLPAAVRLVQTLAPQEADLLARAAQAEQGPPSVVLFRSHARPSVRRALLADARSGATVGLVLTPEDLATAGAIEELRASVPAGAVWIVEDAHRLSVFAPDHLPGLRCLSTLGEVSRVLLTDLEQPLILADLGRCLGFGPEALLRGGGDVPTNVSLTVERDSSVLHSRDALVSALRRHLAAGGASAVVVAPLSGEGRAPGGLPASELVSVGGELGLHVVRDPGEDADAEASRWLEILRAQQGLLLTDDAEALAIVPPGLAPTFLRLVPPPSPETVLLELRVLSRLGGGAWVYTGAAALPPCVDVPLEVLSAVVGRLVAAGQGDGSVAVDLLAELTALGAAGDLPALAREVYRDLERLAGLGLFSAVREVRLSLEVAEASRLRAPFISGDPRYVAFVERYESAKRVLPLAESVRFRVEAREPHDLRVWSRLLGYDVAALNSLFDDLGRDGIVICRQRALGDTGAVNVELRPAASWERVGAELRQGLEHLQRWRDLASAWRAGSEEFLRSDAPRSTLERLLSAVSETLPLPLAEVRAAEFKVPLPPSASTPSTPSSAWSSLSPSSTPLPPAMPPAPAPRTARGDDLQADVTALLAAAELDFDAAVHLAARIASAPNTQVLLARLADGGLPSRLTRALALGAAWEGDAAVDAVEALLADGAELPLARVITRLEHQLSGVSEGADLATIEDAVRRLPLAETLPPEAAAAVWARLPGAPTVEALDMGSTRLRWPEGFSALAERRGAAPEVEARLWLVAHRAGDIDGVPRDVSTARLAEQLLSVVGLGQPELVQALADAVLAWDVEAPTGMDPARWAFARARALGVVGQGDEALRRVIEMAPPPGLEVERMRALGELAAGTDQLPSLVAWLLDTAPASIGTVLDAVRAALEARGRSSELTTLLATYQPAPERLWSFVLSNPLGETAAARLERVSSGLEGAPAPSITTARALFDALGGGMSDAALGRLVARVADGSAPEWVGFARQLAGAGRLAAAASAAERVLVEVPEQPAAHRLLMELALERADARAALVHGAYLRADVVLEALSAKLASGWVPALEALVADEDYPPALRELASALLNEGRERQELASLRAALEESLASQRWEAVTPALEAWVARVPDARDPLTVLATRRRAERLSHLEGRLREAERRGVGSLRTQEIERIVAAAESLGEVDLAQRARQVLAPPPARPERLPTERPTPVARLAEGSEGSGRGARSERGGRSERGERAQAGGRPERSDRGERQERPTRGEAAGRGGRGDRPARRSDGDGMGAGERSAPPARVLAEIFDGPEVSLAGRLRDAIKAAGDDRQRINLVMAVLEQTLNDSRAEGALKGMRQGLDAFERVDRLDGPLCKMVESGLPPDEHLPRLRRALAQVEARFRATFEAISSRENPEPWKQILNQLKLGK